MNYDGWADVEWMHTVGHGPLDCPRCVECNRDMTLVGRFWRCQPCEERKANARG